MYLILSGIIINCILFSNKDWWELNIIMNLLSVYNIGFFFIMIYV